MAGSQSHLSLQHHSILFCLTHNKTGASAAKYNRELPCVAGGRARPGGPLVVEAGQSREDFLGDLTVLWYSWDNDQQWGRQTVSHHDSSVSRGELASSQTPTVTYPKFFVFGRTLCWSDLLEDFMTWNVTATGRPGRYCEVQAGARGESDPDSLAKHGEDRRKQSPSSDNLEP